MPEYIPAILLQNSRNGNPGIPADENSSQTNADSHYSNYSYSGLIPNECALNWLDFSLNGNRQVKKRASRSIARINPTSKLTRAHEYENCDI